MSTLKTTLTGYLKYRGREGQWSFMLHRITGLGTLLFLSIHILDMAAFYWSPDFFHNALELYRSPLFMLLEIVLVFCVFFHGANGIRIAIVDMWLPSKWTISAERNAARWTIVITMILWVPAALYMGIRIFNPAFRLF
ncbi:MAG: succinate dehydrogenase, cytochrome b556 subunit [Anaerolineales bacterium]